MSPVLNKKTAALPAAVFYLLITGLSPEKRVRNFFSGIFENKPLYYTYERHQQQPDPILQKRFILQVSLLLVNMMV